VLRTARLNAYIFFNGALLSYIALFRWSRPITYLASMVVAPLSYMLFFVLLGKSAASGQDTSFYVIGNAVQMAAGSGIFGVTMSISGDRWDGTLPYLFATPANRLLLFVGRAFIHVINGMFGVMLGFMWGVLLLGLDLSKADPIAMALVILITTISTSGMGLFLGCLSLITRNVMFVNNTVFFSLLLFSGANIPVAILPAWMQSVSQALPLTRGIASARIIVDGGNLSEVMPLLRGELLIGVVYIFIGFYMFRWFEIQAKKRGTLEAI